ncbi:pyridoxamine 5'-phosphate oxidase family protein [Ruminococcaceae bacterium OttesenSCG-928-O06]|nr:pyridoxamine 5'-phosphate oxidase family protein [Ruminococcaceae bacterium OttesenSCG-928-O06]
MHTPVPMRRRDRALPADETLALLQAGEYGILATASAAGLPLATPLSYVLLDGALYFHCAKTGQKLDNLAAQPAVCFCVVGATRPVYDDNFTTLYESVVVHGTAALVQDATEKYRALAALCQKYLPAHMHHAEADIAGSFSVTQVVRIAPEEITGKAKRPSTHTT